MSRANATASRGANAPHRSARPRFAAIATPLGEFRLYEMPDGALRSAWKRDVLDDPALAGGVRDPGVRPDLVRSLAGYFANPVKAKFAGAATPSGPAFFRRCWEACRAIPPGRTASYAWLAEQAGGGPYAARAAGQAMRRNPLPVIIPCHRVVASDGRLHGFAGQTSGAALDLKRALLQLEGALA